VREWLTTWLTAVREEVAPKSHERYAEIVRNFLTAALGNMPLHKLAPGHIQEASMPGRMTAWRDGKKDGLFWLSQLSAMLELP
jgi:hypothetical protein